MLSVSTVRRTEQRACRGCSATDGVSRPRGLASCPLRLRASCPYLRVALLPLSSRAVTGKAAHPHVNEAQQALWTSGGRTRQTAAASARAARARSRGRPESGWRSASAAGSWTRTRRSAAAGPWPHNSAPLRPPAPNHCPQRWAQLDPCAQEHSNSRFSPAACMPAAITARLISAAQMYDVQATILRTDSPRAVSSLCGRFE